MADVAIQPLSPERFDDFVSLHARPECQGCFCMFWHFEGDSRAWQLADPEANREAKRARVLAGTTHGLLAYENAVAVGSIQFEPRDTLVKLTARMPYRGLTPDACVWGITCFRVLEAHRRRGVARALLREAVRTLTEVHGATTVEAYPRRGDDLRDDEVWMGPESLFVTEGFVVAREHMQYPVLRRSR